MAEPLVLLVEDDEDLRALLARALPYFVSVAIITAPDGVAGLEMVEQARPDCIILDVKMPELDGFQVARAIRGDPATTDIPLIILTALAQDQDRFAGLASGADRFLQKPATPQHLARVIGEVLAITAVEREQRYQTFAKEEADHD